MELDHFLHKIQGVLKNQQRLLGNLNTVKNENEDDVSKVISSLKNVLVDEEFTHKFKQKLYMLLFLNTDTDVYSNLKKNRKYAHLLRFFPKLSRDLFTHLVISLGLSECLYESVQYFPPVLSYKVLDMCLSVFPWIDLFESIDFVENLIISLFSKIILIDENPAYSTHFKDVFQRLLLHYDSEKGGSIKRMQTWEISKLKHYAGCIMASFFTLLEKCTKIYCKKGECSSEDLSLYNIEISEDESKVKPIPGMESKLFTVQQCYEHIVAKCYENVKAITVDLWLFWVEIDLDNIPNTENTLQRLIGERAYICRETLTEAEQEGVSCKEANDLILKLQNIAIKPHTEEDQMKTMDLVDILANIQDPSKDTVKWLQFLLNNPKFVLEVSAIEVIQNHGNCLEVSDLLKLSSLIFEHIKNNENSAPHKRFVLDMVKCLDIDSQVEVAKIFVNKCGLSETLKTEEFQEVFVETFNKVTGINEDDKEKELYRQFMVLALQSASSVVARAVAEGVTSEVRGHLMAAVLGRLQPFCDAAAGPGGNPLLVKALDQLLTDLPNLHEVQHAHYPLFVRELVMRKNLDGEKFIRGCLMVKLLQHLKTKNWVVLTACLTTLSELNDIKCVCNCAASLVMLVQVQEACRWNPTSYSTAAECVTELTIQLIDQYVRHWMDISYTDEELRNFSDLVRRLAGPLSRYHLSRLLLDEPLPADPALRLMYRAHYGVGEWSVLSLTPEERIALVHDLCFVLPVLSFAEWQDLFCVVAPTCSEYLGLFHIVSDCILVCLDSAKINSHPVVISCLSAAVVKVANSVKYEMNRWTKDDNEYRVSVLSKLCELVASFPPAHQDTFSLTLVKVLQQLLPEGCRRKPLTDDEMNTVTASVAAIHDPHIRHSLSKLFLEMVHR